MGNTLKIILYASAAGLPIIIGGVISSLFQLKPYKIKSKLNHWIVAFGGGALLSAVAFALIPQAITNLSFLELSVIFISGTLSFMFLDILIARIGGSYAQLVSMMMDFLPESLALGASFAHSNKFGLLLAIFIGLQNLPEGFNSYPELRKNLSRRASLLLMLGLSFVGILAALTGEFFLSNHPRIISAIMLFSGGGIIYLIFQDIAPLSKKRKDWIPATGASFGFLIGMLGDKLL